MDAGVLTDSRGIVPSVVHDLPLKLMPASAAAVCFGSRPDFLRYSGGKGVPRFLVQPRCAVAVASTHPLLAHDRNCQEFLRILHVWEGGSFDSEEVIQPLSEGGCNREPRVAMREGAGVLDVVVVIRLATCREVEQRWHAFPVGAICRDDSEKNIQSMSAPTTSMRNPPPCCMISVMSFWTRGVSSSLKSICMESRTMASSTVRSPERQGSLMRQWGSMFVKSFVAIARTIVLHFVCASALAMSRKSESRGSRAQNPSSKHGARSSLLAAFSSVRMAAW